TDYIVKVEAGVVANTRHYQSRCDADAHSDVGFWNPSLCVEVKATGHNRQPGAYGAFRVVLMSPRIAEKCHGAVAGITTGIAPVAFNGAATCLVKQALHRAHILRVEPGGKACRPDKIIRQRCHLAPFS